MKKQGLSVLAAVLFCLATAAFAYAQTTTTTVTKTVQNPDGTYTIVEYPAKKEVMVNLNPVNITGAKGVATILRDDDGTKIKLNLTNVPTDVSALSLYAVDDAGSVSALGPVTLSNGVGALATTTPLTKFMLVVAKEPITTYDANTAVLFRSTAPEGLAVIPFTSARGERVAAVTPGAVVATPGAVVATPGAVVAAPAATQAYQVAMLNIPSYKKGDDEKIKVDFSGAMTGSRANVFITPRKDGPTEVRMKFHDLKDSPAGQKFVLWAVSPDNQFVKLGQVVNTERRNEAEIKSETSLRDFGLLVTMENAEGQSPLGPTVGVIRIAP